MLTNNNNVITMTKFESIEGNEFVNPYSFPLDDFQKNAINIINSNKPHNILVTAHTGSGKSLVAEYTIIHNFKNKKRTIYTSPIKALSNQKYDEFKKKFSDLTYIDDDGNIKNIEIGLITGDNKCNPHADCLILTTEILLNVINFGNLTDENKELTADYINVFDISLTDVKSVIFDEVHYINDQDRGGVWEQCILKLPSSINQVMLSATLDKTETFGNWIYSCNGLPTYILPNYKRVVPLYFSVYYTLNKSLKETLLSNNNIKALITKKSDVLTKEKQIEYCNLTDKLIPLKNTIDEKVNLEQYKCIESLNKHIEAHNINKKITSSAIINNLIEYLSENSMTPCLFFVLSRNKIHQLVESCQVTLNTVLEQHQVENIFNACLRKLNGNYDKIQMINDVKSLAIKGIAIHHSGMLPVLKEIIEILYSKNLIKVLFATETFSVGLNMPTKTVIFTSIKKFDGTTFRCLYSHEFIQMAGRAGRRGIDELGHVIYLPQLEKHFTSNVELKLLLNSKPQSITSKYAINPIYVLRSIYSQSNIVDDIKKTMWFLEKEAIKNGCINELNSMILSNFDSSSEQLKLLEEYHMLDQSGFGNPKRMKTIISKILNFKSVYESYCEYQKKKEYASKLNRTIKYYDDIIDISINSCLTFLENNGYIENIDGRYLINNLGKTAIYLGDNGNPLLMAKLVHCEDFHKLNCNDMIITLSMFCHSGTNDDEDNVKISDKKIESLYDHINNLHIKMINEMNREEIMVGSEWIITSNNFDIVWEWLNGTPCQQIFDTYNVYEGNFIKCMISLNTIISALVNYFKSSGDMEKFDKFAGFEKKIVKDIVTCESIYLLG